MSISYTKSESLFPTDSALQVIATGKDFEYQTCPEAFQFKQYAPSKLLVLDPMPSMEALSVIYPSNYEPYLFHELPPFVKAARNFVQKSKIKKMASLLPDSARVLDVGCGNGALLLLMKDLGPKNWQLFGNDLSAERLSSLEKKGISVICQSVFEMNQKNSFDGIILNQVIEHFHDVHALAQKCYELLKPGGMLWIETPSIEGLDYRLFKKRYWGGYHFPRHFFLFSSQNLPNLLGGHGFKTKEINFLLSPAFWIQSCHHYFLDHGFLKLAALFSIRNPLLLILFSGLDQLRLWTGQKTSNMRVIAVK